MLRFKPSIRSFSTSTELGKKFYFKVTNESLPYFYLTGLNIYDESKVRNGLGGFKFRDSDSLFSPKKLGTHIRGVEVPDMDSLRKAMGSPNPEFTFKYIPESKVFVSNVVIMTEPMEILDESTKAYLRERDVNVDGLDGMHFFLKNAINQGDLSKVKICVDEIRRHNVPGLFDSVIIAVMRGSIEILQYLIYSGADPRVGDDLALMLAVSSKNEAALEIVKILLNAGLDPKVETRKLLLGAARNGNVEILKLLIGDSEFREPEVLLEACKIRDNESMVKLLIKLGSDCSFNDYQALKTAVYCNNTSVVKILPCMDLKNESDMSKVLGDCLVLASSMGHSEMVKLLIKNPNLKQADIAHENHFALSLAAEKGHLEIVQILVEAGSQITTCKNYLVPRGAGCAGIGYDPLHYPIRHAAKNNHIEVVKFLVSEGAYPYESDSSMVLDCVERGHFELANYLLSKNDKEDFPKVINSYFKIAAGNGHLMMMEYIRYRYGSHIQINDLDLDLAAGNGHFHVVRYIWDLGLRDLKKIDAGIKAAAIGSHMEIVQYLAMEKHKMMEECVKEVELKPKSRVSQVIWTCAAVVVGTIGIALMVDTFLPEYVPEKLRRYGL